LAAVAAAQDHRHRKRRLDARRLPSLSERGGGEGKGATVVLLGSPQLLQQYQ